MRNTERETDASEVAPSAPQPEQPEARRIEQFAHLLCSRPRLNDVLAHLALISIFEHQATGAALHDYAPDGTLHPLAGWGTPDATADHVHNSTPLGRLASLAPTRGRTGASTTGTPAFHAWCLQPTGSRMKLLSISTPGRGKALELATTMAYLLPTLELYLTLHSQPAHTSVLTKRQLRVLELMSDGLTDRQIAAKLGFSESTIGLEARRIYHALSVKTRQAAVSEANRRGMLEKRKP